MSAYPKNLPIKPTGASGISAGVSSQRFLADFTRICHSPRSYLDNLSSANDIK